MSFLDTPDNLVPDTKMPHALDAVRVFDTDALVTLACSIGGETVELITHEPHRLVLAAVNTTPMPGRVGTMLGHIIIDGTTKYITIVGQYSDEHGLACTELALTDLHDERTAPEKTPHNFDASWHAAAMHIAANVGTDFAMAFRLSGYGDRTNHHPHVAEAIQRSARTFARLGEYIGHDDALKLWLEKLRRTAGAPRLARHLDDVDIGGGRVIDEIVAMTERERCVIAQLLTPDGQQFFEQTRENPARAYDALTIGGRLHDVEKLTAVRTLDGIAALIHEEEAEGGTSTTAQHIFALRSNDTSVRHESITHLKKVSPAITLIFDDTDAAIKIVADACGDDAPAIVAVLRRITDNPQLLLSALRDNAYDATYIRQQLKKYLGAAYHDAIVPIAGDAEFVWAFGSHAHESAATLRAHFGSRAKTIPLLQTIIDAAADHHTCASEHDISTGITAAADMTSAIRRPRNHGHDRSMCATAASTEIIFEAGYRINTDSAVLASRSSHDVFAGKNYIDFDTCYRPMKARAIAEHGLLGPHAIGIARAMEAMLPQIFGLTDASRTTLDETVISIIKVVCKQAIEKPAKLYIALDATDPRAVQLTLTCGETSTSCTLARERTDIRDETAHLLYA